MKFLLQILLIIILTAIAEIFLPWWSLIISCFLVSFFIYHTRASAFWGGLIGVAILWMTYAYYIDNKTSSILTLKIAQLFNLPETVLAISNTILLIIISGLIGGITGGFASLTGHLFREFFTRKDRF